MRFFQSVHEWFCGPTELGKRLVTIGEANMRLAGNRISTTKYTVLTFLPKFLVEQFSNVVNVFFLILACAQVVPYFEPPYGRATTIAPLCFILLLAAGKEIFEDVRRKLSDRKINRTVARVFDKQRGWHNCFWCKIRVGQIVKVMNGEKIPADLVLLSSSEPGGMAYIETSNLDGESNLKIRQALTTTSKLINDEMILTLLDRRAFIHCDLPNCLIYEFQGTMHLTRDPCPSSSRQHSGSTARSVRQTPLSASTPLTPHEMLVFPLSTGHLMPRGSRLMNTETAYGVVIYAGKHTKLMMNQTRTPAKSSIVNQMTNYVMMVHFGVLMVMSATATALSLWHSYKNRFNEWYLPLQQDQQFNEHPLEKTKSRGPAMKIFFTELMLFSRIIPISLLVTLEFIRLIQAWLIENDLEMYDERTDSRAVVRRSELNDMLGQVRCVMTDKTGTLTQNSMVFKMCSIGARRYGSPASEHFDNQLLLTDLHLGVKEKQLIWDFLLISAVCHTVIPEKHHSEKSSAETVEYNASSPDEAALVRFARDAGVVFHTRTPEYVLVDMFGKTHRFEVLNVLEFTSDRKRMGVIVRTEEGKLRLFVKGADCVVLPRVRRNNPEVFAATLKNLDDFARLGYRTLCLASRELGAEEYAKWEPDFTEAATLLSQRKNRLAAAAEDIEKDLQLVGVTAIEDKLQEGVQETIGRFLDTGMKVWVLTGDKMETAVNIGHSCNLIRPSMETLLLPQPTDLHYDAVLHKIAADLELRMDDPERRLCVIADSDVLQAVIDQAAFFEFARITLRARVVICCRCTPKQKAAMVRLVSSNLNGTTLAIGDGANDVAMIQAAHVGVGLSGAEGMQASMAADYSIAQFRFLQRLLFVHGVLSFCRTTKAMFYSCYKNCIETFLLFVYTFMNGFSEQGLMDQWTVILYNMCFTSLAPMWVGVFDRPADVDHLFRHNHFYTLSQDGKQLSFKASRPSSSIDRVSVQNHAGWLLHAVFDAVLIFTIIGGIHFYEPMFFTGHIASEGSFGTVAALTVITVVNVRGILEIDSINWIAVTLAVLSVASYAVFLLIYPAVYWMAPTLSDEYMKHVFYEIFSNPSAYFGLALVVFSVVAAHVALRLFLRMMSTV